MGKGGGTGLGVPWGAQIWTIRFMMPIRHPMERSCRQLDRRVVFREVWVETDICPQIPTALW